MTPAVTIGPTGIAVGVPPDHPELTELVEARGALLHWNVLDRDRYPTARIHDPDRAAEWLWEVYGTTAAQSILAGETPEAHDGDPVTLAALSTAARLGWCRVWWPASWLADIPPLPVPVLTAELAVATAELEHLLDDPDAVARALADTDPDALAELAGTFPRLSTLHDRLVDLLDDHGVVPQSVPTPTGPQDWALAAGDRLAAGPVIMSGTSPVDWRLVAPGTVDAAADAAWRLSADAGRARLTVSVLAAPLWRSDSVEPALLTARFHRSRFPLRRDGAAGDYTGESDVDNTVWRLPAADRAVVVHSPGLAPEETDPDDPAAAGRRAAVIEHARARLADPLATLTERSARP